MVLGIYGASGLGREILELAFQINRVEKRWEGFIFIDDKPMQAVNGIAVYSYKEALTKYAGNIEVAIGVGEPATREKLYAKLSEDGISTPTLIHPSVYIPETTKIGKGVTIQAGCFISCNVVIEDQVYIQPQANIGHDDILKKGCVLSGMANIGGNVTIGKYSYVGLSVAVKQGINIGEYSVVGMYSAVYKDIPDEIIAMGNPARAMKKNEGHKVF